MPKLSISESARRAGVARSTLYEYYIKPGKISVEVDGRGNKVIDVAELLRVFGELKGGPIQVDSIDGHGQDEGGHGRTVVSDDTRQLAGQVMQLKTELDAARQLVEAKAQVIAAKDEAIAALQRNADDLRSALEERSFQVLQLENKLAPGTTEKRGFWSRLMRKQ